jgi:hypothetical protein
MPVMGAASRHKLLKYIVIFHRMPLGTTLANQRAGKDPSEGLTEAEKNRSWP